MADEQLNVGIGLSVKGTPEAKAAFDALRAGAAETGAAFQAAAVRAKALADAVTAAQALSSQALGIPAEAAGIVSAEGLGAVVVAQGQQAQAQAYINKLKLDAVAITQAEAVALREQAAAAAEAGRIEAAAAAEAAAAQERLAAITAGSTAELFQQAAGEEEVGAAAASAAIGASAFLAPMLELFAAFEAFRGFKDFVETGTHFNSTIESARIGIAAVTTALGTLSDAQGHVLTGEQAFQAGLGIADSQIAKLQVDALRTATTMQDLVGRFQAAEGAGLRAGATLDQIRQIVVGASQAAGALGVPYEQLNATLVQLLNGHIRVTNRLTADLGLSQQQIRAWKESGTLVEHLVELFGRFDIIGEHVQGTWRGILSNIKQAFQIFTGEATSGLFTTLEQGVNQALHNVFDFKTGGLTSEFSGLAEGLRTGLGAAGQLVVDLIQKMVAGAEELSHWFETHQEETAGIVRNAVALVENIGRVLASVIEIGAKITLWVTQSGLVQATFRALADITQVIADHLGLIATIIGIRIIANLGVELGVAATAAGGLGAALLAMLNPVTLTIAAIGAAIVAVEAFRNHEDAVRRAADQARQSFIAQSESAATLTGEFRALVRELDSGTLSSEQKRAAQQRLKDITDQLIAISPDYRAAIDAESGSITGQAKAIEDLTAKREHDLAQRAIDAQAQVATLAAQEKSLQATLEQLGAEGADQVAFEGTRRELDRTTSQLETARVAADQLHQALLAFRRDEAHPPAPSGVTLHGNVSTDTASAKDKTKQIEDARIESIKAIADAQKKYLDAALRENELSYADYFARLNAIELTSIDVQIAAKQKLLFGTEVPEPGAKPLATVDPGQRAQLIADIQKLELEKTAIVETNATKRAALEDALDKKVTEASVQYLKDTGQAAKAFALQFDEQYRALYARLDAESNQAGKQVIDNLFQAGLAKAQAEDLKQSVEQALKAPEAQVKEIQQLVKTHAIDEERGRNLVIAAYQRELAIIEQALAKARELAATEAQQPGGVAPQTAAEITDLQQKAAAVRDALAEIQQGAQRVKVEFAQGISRDLATFLTETVEKAHTARQAFSEFGASVIETVQRIIAALIQAKIEQAILGLLGVGQSASSGADAGGSASSGLAGFVAGLAAHGFAGGGMVSGSGGPTEDSVPAMLSAGEYVVPAHAVSRLGADFFDTVVTGARMPAPVIGRQHFASGGLVAVGPVGGHAPRDTQPTHLRIELDQGLILSTISSAPGHKVIVEAMQKNPSAVRQSLRLPSQP
ncbi:MAG TPA: hypothetical protein VN607_03135 [Gemmatimonadaceae bacterium]|nr:hypothetical protein [Gemmatimonadaceae bacterium]